MIEQPAAVLRALLPKLHDILTRRGWVVDDWDDHIDERGVPTNPETAMWIWPMSYGGIEFNDLNGVAPIQAQCSIIYDEVPPVVGVEEAKNYGTCAVHARKEHRVPLDDLDNGFTAFLDGVEQRATATDIHELINCRMFGPCGTGSFP